MLGRPAAQELAPADPEFLQVEAAQRLEFQLERIAAPVGGGGRVRTWRADRAHQSGLLVRDDRGGCVRLDAIEGPAILALAPGEPKPLCRKPVRAARVVCGATRVAAIRSSRVAPSSRPSNARMAACLLPARGARAGRGSVSLSGGGADGSWSSLRPMAAKPSRVILRPGTSIIIRTPVGLIGADGNLVGQASPNEPGREGLGGLVADAVGAGEQDALVLSRGAEEHKVGVGELHRRSLRVDMTGMPSPPQPRSRLRAGGAGSRERSGLRTRACTLHARQKSSRKSKKTESERPRRLRTGSPERLRTGLHRGRFTAPEKASK